MRPGKALPPLLLDDEEALAVAITLRTAAAGSVGGIEETALRALIKLEQVMPARLRRRTALRAAVVPLEPHGPTVDAALLATLATACRDQLRVAFDYRDGRGQASSRMVEPQGVAHASQRWYLVAWDPARDDWRIFRLDRIAGPATTARTSRRVLAWRGDLREYVSRTLRLGAYPAHARIVLHAPRRPWPPASRPPPARSMRSTTPAACCVAARRLWTA